MVNVKLLSELGLLGVLWDSWDLALVVWGIGFRVRVLVGWGFPASAGIPRSHRFARSRPLTLCEGGGYPSSLGLFA